MLKADLIRPRLKIKDDRVWSRSIPADYHYLQIAADLLRLYQRHVGQSRGRLADALREYEGDSLEYPIIRGLAAVIEGDCVFGSDPALPPAELRTALFERGPVTVETDLFNQTRRKEVMAEVAAEYGVAPHQIEAAFLADLAEEQILQETGSGFTPADLIARYNLELARGLLYWAREVRIVVRGGYKDLFKYIKLFKLMYTIRPAEAGYHITLHGPISPFVKSTIRYGLQFAKFFPALLLCPAWQMEADVQPPGLARREPCRYTLDDRTPLRTHFKESAPFDSKLEADFAAEFEAKYSGPARQWELAREDELIILDDTVMIPDFSLTHRRDGRRVLIEIVGFWHPRYLQRKLAKVRRAGRTDLILLVYQSVNVAEGTFEAASAGEVLTFVRKPILKEVLAAAERCAAPPVTPPPGEPSTENHPPE